MFIYVGRSPFSKLRALFIYICKVPYNISFVLGAFLGVTLHVFGAETKL
jgi:hypothetical protein